MIPYLIFVIIIAAAVLAGMVAVIKLTVLCACAWIVIGFILYLDGAFGGRK
jgi:hypothetical protein